MSALQLLRSEIMVWVKRTLWGWEERKKGKTTVPFFSGDKVLSERKALNAPGGGWGQGVPMALGLHSCSVVIRMKLLSSPQNISVLWAAGNHCRATALTKHTSFKPDHVTLPPRTFAIWLCTIREVYAPRPGTQCPPRPDTLLPFGFCLSPTLHWP